MTKTLFSLLRPGQIFFQSDVHGRPSNHAFAKLHKASGCDIQCQDCGTDQECWNATNFVCNVHFCPNSYVFVDHSASYYIKADS